MCPRASLKLTAPDTLCELPSTSETPPREELLNHALPLVSLSNAEVAPLPSTN